MNSLFVGAADALVGAAPVFAMKRWACLCDRRIFLSLYRTVFDFPEVMAQTLLPERQLVAWLVSPLSPATHRFTLCDCSGPAYVLGTEGS